MINVRIVYATMTGHSRKIAQAIGDRLDVKPEKVKDSPNLQDVDLLFVVGGLYGGASRPDMLQFIGTLDNSRVKQAVLITSCASGHQKQDGVRKLLTEKGIEVVDEHICQGSFLFAYFGHPNADDISKAVRFAQSKVRKA